MTSCARYADLDFVERYVLGQMEEAEQASFEAHFFECPDCFAAVQAMQTAQTALRAQTAVGEERESSPPGAETNAGTSGRVVEFHAAASRANGGKTAAKAGSGGSSRMMTGAAWIGLAAAASLTGVLVWAPWRGKTSPPERTTTIAKQVTPTGSPTPPVQPEAGQPNAGQPASGTTASGSSGATPQSSGQPPGIGTATGSTTPAPRPTKPPISLEALALVMPPPYVPLQTRGAEGTPAQAFAAAMTKYSAKDYRGAVDGLKPIVDAEADPGSIPAQFFLGISHLALNEPAAASAVLNRVASSNVSPYADEAHFYLAKAAIGARDLDRAERELSIAIDRQAGPPNEAVKLQQALRTYRREHGQD